MIPWKRMLFFLRRNSFVGKFMIKIKENVRIAKLIAVVIACIIICGGCCKSRELPICDIISDIFQEERIENCSITSLKKYDDISVQLEIPNVSDEEIYLYIDEQLTDAGIEQLTDENVKEHFNCGNITEYKEQVIKILVDRKKIESIMIARRQVMDELINRSDFDISYNAVEICSLKVIENYEREAYLHGMDLPEYAENILKISYDDFFKLAYEEGERKIETYLIIGAIGYELFEDNNIYYDYQELENTVYSVFIKAGDGF